MKTTLRIAVTLIVAHMLSAGAWAQEGRQTEVVNTTEGELRRGAMEWGITETEYKRYLKVMAGERGTWSPGLDPITALGVSADTAADRQRFAELFVKKEYERTKKELAFQIAVDAAWKKLYPSTPRLATRATPKTGAARPVRFAVITRSSCASCDDLLDAELTGMTRRAAEGVDIYVVGAGDDDALRAWAEAHPEVLEAVEAGRATLNHGREFEGRVDLPTVYEKRGDGQWAER